MKHLFYFLFLFVLATRIVAQDSPNRGSIGFSVGVSKPIGVYGSQKIGSAGLSDMRESYAKSGIAYNITY